MYNIRSRYTIDTNLLHNSLSHANASFAETLTIWKWSIVAPLWIASSLHHLSTLYWTSHLQGVKFVFIEVVTGSIPVAWIRPANIRFKNILESLARAWWYWCLKCLRYYWQTPMSMARRVSRRQYHTGAYKRIPVTQMVKCWYAMSQSGPWSYMEKTMYEAPSTVRKSPNLSWKLSGVESPSLMVNTDRVRETSKSGGVPFLIFHRHEEPKGRKAVAGDRAKPWALTRTDRDFQGPGTHRLPFYATDVFEQSWFPLYLNEQCHMVTTYGSRELSYGQASLLCKMPKSM